MKIKFKSIGAELPEGPLPDESPEEALFEHASVDEIDKSLINAREKQASLLFKRVGYYRGLYFLRLGSAIFIFLLIALWLVGVMWLVFLGSYEVHTLVGACEPLEQGSLYSRFLKLPDGCSIEDTRTFLSLSKEIVIALITTTTINVLGLSFIVAKWLFPSQSSK